MILSDLNLKKKHNVNRKTKTEKFQQQQQQSKSQVQQKEIKSSPRRCHPGHARTLFQTYHHYIISHFIIVIIVVFILLLSCCSSKCCHFWTWIYDCQNLSVYFLKKLKLKWEGFFGIYWQPSQLHKHKLYKLMMIDDDDYRIYSELREPVKNVLADFVR